MVSATLATTAAATPAKASARPRLPAWLEIAKPRLIPLLLATTLGGMALAEGWPSNGLTITLTLRFSFDHQAGELGHAGFREGIQGSAAKDHAVMFNDGETIDVPLNFCTATLHEGSIYLQRFD